MKANRYWFFATVLAVSSGSFGTVTIELVPTDTSPITGPSRRTIAVYLHNDNPLSQPLSGFLFSYQASHNGVATAVPAIGSATSSGSGTRYNTPQWDGNTVTGIALSPPSGSIPSAPSSLPYYGTVTIVDSGESSSYLGGFVVIDVLPPVDFRGTFAFIPAEFHAYGLYGEELPVGIRSNAVFNIVPEPLSVALFLPGLGLFVIGRRRNGSAGIECSYRT